MAASTVGVSRSLPLPTEGPTTSSGGDLRQQVVKESMDELVSSGSSELQRSRSELYHRRHDDIAANTDTAGNWTTSLSGCHKTRNYHYYTYLTASFPEQPGYASTRKVEPVWRFK